MGRNLLEHEELARSAARAGASLVLFPELSLTGYELELADELAFEVGDQRLGSLADLASEASIHVVVGAPLRTSLGLHVALFVLTPSRRVDLYTKQYLGAFPSHVNPNGPVPPPEPSLFVPGPHDPLLGLEDESVSFAICADTGREAHARSAAARGASIYAASVFAIPEDRDADGARLARYAVEHGFLVLFANFGAPTGGLPAAGRSAIWSPAGELLAELPERGSGLLVAERGHDGFRAIACG